VTGDHVATASADELAAEAPADGAPDLPEAPEAPADVPEPAQSTWPSAATAEQPSDETISAMPAQPAQAVEDGLTLQASPGDEVGGSSEMAAATSEQSPEQSPPPAEGTASTPAASEPELVEVWRPGGRSRGADQRTPRRPPRRHRQDRAPQKAPDAEQVAAAAPTEERAEAPAAVDRSGEADRERHRRRRRGPPGEFRGGRETRDSERPGRWTSERSEQRAHFTKDHGEPKDRRDYAPRREREKQPDPDSPFAKLAALKAQLEANSKERR
jgi:ATP-dependent RNA helicase SUPV3L1/SUV3